MRAPSLFSLRRGLLLCLLGLCAASLHAQQPAPCDSLYTQAESAFFDSRFDETIRLLSPCVEPPNAPASVETYRLLGMAYMNQGDAFGARQTLRSLLLAAPGYEPDPVQDPPSYTVLVLIIRDQLQQQDQLPASSEVAERAAPNRRRGTWLGIGAGLVVVGLIAIFAGG